MTDQPLTNNERLLPPHLGRHGWQLDADATAWVRRHGDHPFSQRQGLVFVQEGRHAG